MSSWAGMPAWMPLCKESSSPSGALGDLLSLLHRLERQELNCYMYAPKDELKHRLLWREPYTEHEAGSGSAGPHHGWAVASQSSQVMHGLHLSQGQAGCYCSSCQKPAQHREPPDPAHHKVSPWTLHRPWSSLCRSLAICSSVPGPADPCGGSSVFQHSGHHLPMALLFSVLF